MSDMVEKIRLELKDRVKSLPSDSIYQEDFQRWLSSDWQIKRFYVATRATAKSKNEMEMIQMTVESIIKNLIWRKKEQLNETTEKDFPEEFFQTNLLGFAVTPCGRNIFYINTKLYRRVPEYTSHLQAFGRTIIDRLDKSLNGKRMTLFLDLSELALVNADVLFLKYFLGLLTYEYPLALEQTLIYLPPWYIKPFITMVIGVLPSKLTKNITVLDSASAINLLGLDGIPKGAGGKLNTEIIAPKGAISMNHYIVKHNLSKESVNKALRAYSLLN